MISDAVLKLLQERYFLENENTWEDLSKRVSAIYPPIYDDLAEMKFIPSSPTLMNANTTERIGTLSSCFTMGIEDSIEGIYDSLKEGAIVTKASGGVGYVFSKLRSSYEDVNSLKRKSSGPIPFMKNFDSMLDGIQQGGVRRGAGMGQFNINHPNILDVIRLKATKGIMERLNISIRINDEFYTKLKENPQSPHIVTNKKGISFPLIDNDKVVSVKKLWDEIIEYAWRCAEPGIFNIDTATRQCTVTDNADDVLSNPCAEYVNIEYSSCNLGSLNLSKFVTYDGTGKRQFDWVDFDKSIRLATRFLDAVIDVNNYPLQKIADVTKSVRPIGLGAMGYAHMLFLLKIPFNSEEANILTDMIFERLTMISMDESCEIAKERGCSYPAFNVDMFLKSNERFFNKVSKDEEWNEFVKNVKLKVQTTGVANSCNTSIAPNGSISFIGDTTGGIEPLFALAFVRKIEKLNREYEYVYIADPIFNEYLIKNYDEKTTEKILKQVGDNKGSCQTIKEIPETMRKVFVVAGDLTPIEHLNSLSIVAKNTSLSVSKCISHDSLVYTTEGLSFIADLSNNRTIDTFSDLNISIENKDNISENVKSFYYNGIKQCKKITLSNGIQFTATPTHKILLKDNLWESMENLEIDNIIK
jgi:ribonucleoside-diphosphate reductase alpha chain